MLSRPTTQQILLDCRAELLATIDAALTDPAAKVAVQMMENVLRNCAERAAHEIAWMHDESAAAVSFAERVQASQPDDALRRAIDDYRNGRSDSLHLDDVVATYHLAGECLSAAIDVAMGSSDAELQRAGHSALDDRLGHEQAIMGEWSFVGRG